MTFPLLVGGFKVALCLFILAIICEEPQEAIFESSLTRQRWVSWDIKAPWEEE